MSLVWWFFLYLYIACALYIDSCYHLCLCISAHVCIYIYIYVYIHFVWLYVAWLSSGPSAWCMTCLFVWDSHASPCFDSSYIYIYVFETFPYIFHFSCNFLIRLGCIILLGMTISLYYGCSSIELVIRSKI